MCLHLRPVRRHGVNQNSIYARSIGGNLGKAKGNEKFLGLWEEGHWEQATVQQHWTKVGVFCAVDT